MLPIYDRQPGRVMRNTPFKLLDVAEKMIRRSGVPTRIKSLLGLDWQNTAKPRFAYNAPHPVGEADIALASRLIAAYRRAAGVAAAADVSEVWDRAYARHWQALVRCLSDGEPAALASRLANMFHEPFMWGISSADMVDDALKRGLIESQTLLHLARLCEYLGLVNSEAAEQGPRRFAFNDGYDEVLSRLEAALGVPLGFPDIGASYGVSFAGRMITPEQPEDLYVALRFAAAIDRALARRRPRVNVLEIGAGSGGTCFAFLRLQRIPVGSYTIVDLPMASVLQGYFLAKALPDFELVLFGEEPTRSERSIRLLPPQGLTKIAAGTTHAVLNENSMPEMSEAAVADYLGWIAACVDGLFFSYNHEAPNGQVWVSRAAGGIPGLARIERTPSWVRPGYVEEIYQTTDAGGPRSAA